jgi:putative oxidoreductase
MAMNENTKRETELLFPALAEFYARVSDLAYPMVRIVVASIIFIHGWGKFNGNMAGIAASMARMGLEPSVVFAYSAVFLETIGAICILIGLFTRFFAAALAIEMFIAFIVVHLPKGFSVSGGGYEYVFLLGILLFAIALRGGARYSVDRIIGKEL